MKQALKEAKMNVKDTRKIEKEFENAWESASGRKAFRAKVVGQEARDLAKYIMNKEIWDTAEVKQRSEWESSIPQDRDWETDTQQAVNVVKRMELTSSSMEIVMVSPRNLETVGSQRQYFQNPVLVLVLEAENEFTMHAMRSSWKE